MTHNERRARDLRISFWLDVALWTIGPAVLYIGLPPLVRDLIQAVGELRFIR